MERIIPVLVALVLLLAGCAVPRPPSPPEAIYPGFDTWRYPGDEVMTEWRRSSPYRWVGYYLPAPCHRSESFVGRRDFLERTGWGIAVLYVGQQIFEGQTPAEITETTVCSSLLLTPDQGRIDGQDAAHRAASEGFPRGTVIFLDIERMGRIAPEMIAYYQGWIRAVLADGRYRPGTYAHVADAAGLYAVGQAALQTAGVTESMPFWVAGGQGFTLASAPAAVGYRFATIWQGALDVRRSWGGHSLVIDENVATRPSPSAP